MQQRHIRLKYDKRKPLVRSRSARATFLIVYLPMSYVTPALSIEHCTTDEDVCVAVGTEKQTTQVFFS